MSVNVIYGTSDQDNLTGTTQLDLILSKGGSDQVLTKGGDDTVYADDGDDTVFGFAGGNHLYGGSGDDFLVTTASTSDKAGYIYGGGGNDRIFASDASNFTYGGAGNDEVSVFFNLGGEAGGGAGIDTLVLNLTVTATGSQSFEGGILVVLRGADAGATAGSLHMAFEGFEFLDVTTDSGDDTVHGGDFADRIDVWSGANVVRAYAGSDIVSYHTGAANHLNGGAGEDTLQIVANNAPGGLSFAVNGAFASDGSGSFLLNFEHYLAIGSTWDDTVQLGELADEFRGLDGADSGLGMGGDDRLLGGAGNDSLYGGDGRDALSGGKGQDSLFGCDGADTFLFAHADWLGDVIGDMVSGEDQVAIRGRVLGDVLAKGVVDAALFHLDTAVGADAQFVYRATAGIGVSALIWDRNGTDNGGEVLIALFDGSPALTAADLLIY